MGEDCGEGGSMRRIVLFLFAVSIFCRVGVLSAADTNPLKYTCYRTEKPVVLDALPDDPAWKKAAPMKDWTICVDNKKLYQPAGHATTSWMCWDAENLYLAWVCADTDIMGNRAKKDLDVWEDDAFEIYIDPDGDGLNYVEIEISPLNYCLDLLIPAPWKVPWKEAAVFNVADMKYATRVYGTLNFKDDTDEKWAGEIAIPFSSLSDATTAALPVNLPPKNGDVWRIQCYRAEHWKKGRTGVEWNAWSPTKAPHNLGEFAYVTFSDKTQ